MLNRVIRRFPILCTNITYILMSGRIARVISRSLMSSARVFNTTSTTTNTITNEAEKTINQAPETPQLQETEDEAEFFESVHTEALKLKARDETLLNKQLYEILTGRTTSELTSKLSQNKELVSELKDFVEEFTINLDNHKIRGATKRSLDSDSNQYPRLEPSLKEEPYTPQELFLRRQFAKNQNLSLGSHLHDVYIPHKEVFYPTTSSNLSIAKLLASGAHLGHSKSLYRASNQQYIYGEYKGIHIIDLEKTLSHLKKAAKVIQGVAAKGGVILYVGTREGQARSLEVAAQRTGGYYVASKWTAGTLTNSTEISTWARQEVDLGDNKTGRELTPSESKRIIKPDLIVVLNPTENRVLLSEAMQTRVPTIGIIDTDSEPSLVTYPIPANDDSIRATTLITGVLSKAAEVGYKTRLREFSRYKAQTENVTKPTEL